MKRLTSLLFIGFLMFSMYGCGGASGERADSDSDQYLPIQAEMLPGTWTCTRFVLDIGMENEMMARMQGDLVFTESDVVYMGQTYPYSIENDRILVTYNGQEILRPLAWDGESLVMQGDNAMVYYQRQ